MLRMTIVSRPTQTLCNCPCLAMQPAGDRQGEKFSKMPPFMSPGQMMIEVASPSSDL